MESGAELSLSVFNERLVNCQRCSRLVSYRQQIAIQKRHAFECESYWGKPVPGLGDPSARLLILGLAPGAHGANRTGRMFTGDKAGDFLFQSLYDTGFAEKPAVELDQIQYVLRDVYLTNAVRCVPPANLPTLEEQERCRAHLIAELSLLANVEVVLALGKIAFENFQACTISMGYELPQPRPKFQHGRAIQLENWQLIASYHPSQRNTQTGRLTALMFNSILIRCKELLGNENLDGARESLSDS